MSAIRKQEYTIIALENFQELKESVRVGNLSGMVAVGPVIRDQGGVLQVMRKVREGYITADGEPCDGNGKVLGDYGV